MINRQRSAAILLGLAIAIACVRPAAACGPTAEVWFVEGSPDQFTVVNKSADAFRLMKVTIDLEGSRGDLVFDTARGGGGVAGYQSFEPIGGTAVMTRLAAPEDAGRLLALEFLNFPPGADFSFTVDVDDQLPSSPAGQPHIDGGEMTGAEARVIFQGPDGKRRTIGGRFGDDDRAIVSEADCVSRGPIRDLTARPPQPSLVAEARRGRG